MRRSRLSGHVVVGWKQHVGVTIKLTVLPTIYCVGGGEMDGGSSPFPLSRASHRAPSGCSANIGSRHTFSSVLALPKDGLSNEMIAAAPPSKLLRPPAAAATTIATSPPSPMPKAL